MNKIYAVYIITNYNETAFYTGITSNLEHRTYQHKEKLMDGFTKKYNCCKVVFYELTDSVENAIKREKQIKNWHRQWKINLIKENNPQMLDLSEQWLDPETSSG